jgi:hypothetical protein
MSRLNKALSAPYLRLRIGLLISALPGTNIPGPLPPAVSGRSSAIVNRSGAIVHVL